MRESSPFDASPIARRKRNNQQEITPAIPLVPEESKTKPPEESRAVLDERIEEAQKRAETIADRMRDLLRIPKSITQEVQQAKQADAFKDVNQFNADETQMPNIVRKPNKLSKWLLSITALGAIGATHEPQIERGVKEGVKIVKDLAADTEQLATSKWDITKKFWARHKPFGREAYADTGEELQHGEAEQTGSDTEQREASDPRLEKFLKSLPPLSQEQRRAAQDLIAEHARTYGHIDMGKFFLTMEYLHGRITEEQRTEAQERFDEQINAVREKLSAEPGALEDVRRVAFELAKQRKTYVRGKADQYTLITEEETNCDGLTGYVHAGLNRLRKPTWNIKTQIFEDHVRLLMKNTHDDQLYALEGHDVIPVTTEDLKGTLIGDPKTMVERTLQLETDPKKPAQKRTGSESNALVQWNTRDERIPTRSFLPGEAPLHIDEKAQANKSYQQLMDEKREHLRIIDVPIQFMEGAVEQPQKPEEEKREEITSTPNALEVSLALENGTLNGRFTDLKPLEGISIEQLLLSKPYQRTTDVIVDLSPLQTSRIQKIDLDDDVHPSNFENLSFANFHDVSASLQETTFWNKVVKEATQLDKIVVELGDEKTFDQQVRVYTQGPMMSTLKEKEILAAIQQKLTAQKTGEFFVTTHSPFESVNSTWKFDGKTGKWRMGTTQEEDYLTVDARYGLNQIAETGEVIFSSELTNDGYLLHEKIDLSKITSARFIVNESQSDHESSFPFFVELNTLKGATKLDTITIEVDGNIGEIDVLSLKNLSFKKLVIKYNSFASERPNDHLTIKGLEGKKVTIKHDL